MTKKKIIIQPGKMGDIVITTPIAKHYHEMGYEIVWPVFDNYKNYFDAFDYINSITVGASMDPYSYYQNTRIDRNDPNVFLNAGVQFFQNLLKWYEGLPNPQDYEMLDFCFTFPGHAHPVNNQLCQIFQKRNRNWIDLKYYLANTPLQKRWNLEWQRNHEKENKLYDFIKSYAQKKYNSDEYSIVHKYKGGKDLKKVDVPNPISFSYIKGYEIYDWTTVLENAKSIVCVDSCLANFVEVVPSLRDVEKHYLGSEEPHFHAYMRNILLNNWVNHSDSKIDYGGFSL